MSVSQFSSKMHALANWCLSGRKIAVIARSEATWQSPGSSEIFEKWTNALTNRPELLGDCHDQCAHWSRNDSSNERSNTNFSFCRAAFSSPRLSPEAFCESSGYKKLYPLPEGLPGSQLPAAFGGKRVWIAQRNLPTRSIRSGSLGTRPVVRWMAFSGQASMHRPHLLHQLSNTRWI